MRCSGYFLLPTVKLRLRPPLLMDCAPGLTVNGTPTIASQLFCSLTTSTGFLDNWLSVPGPRRPESHHRHAARHRFVQQTGDVAVGVGVEGQAQQQQWS